MNYEEDLIYGNMCGNVVCWSYGPISLYGSIIFQKYCDNALHRVWKECKDSRGRC